MQMGEACMFFWFKAAEPAVRWYDAWVLRQMYRRGDESRNTQNAGKLLERAVEN